ncbi:MAG: ADP-ribosylation factor-like protein [Bacteroidetes bacterium]|nr:ADP-ribosylation factor-like protein [Bacteroidota bacterium]
MMLITGNPLEFPPASVIELGPDTTQKYYEDAEQYGHAPLSEGRIIFIGDGSSGKSSIVEKTLYNTFTLGREQTNGIKIEHFSLAHPDDGRNLNFHIWDFGGQEIQHAVHKFFFTEGCLYVLVLDNRKEEEPEYWLQQIESLGGSAPVLVVFNKQDENAVETTDRKYLKEKYPNIVGFFNTSCKSGFGIEDFKKRMYEEVANLRTVAEQFPNNWLAVKKAIEENTTGSHHYLTYEAYKEICKKNQLVTEQAQQLLLRYFNTIGTVTWFGEDTYLKFMHVLNPAWITQGVYKILTATKTAHLFGQIKVSDFTELLQPVSKGDYTYDEAHYAYLLSMMKKFSLCYTSDDANLLIPSAFGKEPKLEYSDFKGDDVRTYILQFRDYMPLALIHRFTAQKMPDVLDNNYWYTGIVIKDRITDAVAMVHADKEAKRIYVRIKGESKLGIWEQVRRDFATIASSYARIPYDELVQLDEKSGSTVTYLDLVSHIKAQKTQYFHPRLQRDFNVGYLMNLFEPKENTTDKIVRGEIILGDRERNVVPANVPPYVINILNNNNPVVSTQVNVQVNIDIQVVNELGAELKGDAGILLEALGESNKALREALQKAIQFAEDARSARNTGDIKEKGWGRKLKGVLDTLGSAGEQIKNISEGSEVLSGVLKSIKNLAGHFNLDNVLAWFS